MLVNNIGADQPAHPHSLISAIVICYIETCYERNFNFLANLAEQAGLDLTFSDTPTTGFHVSWPKLNKQMREQTAIVMNDGERGGEG